VADRVLDNTPTRLSAREQSSLFERSPGETGCRVWISRLHQGRLCIECPRASKPLDQESGRDGLGLVKIGKPSATKCLLLAPSRMNRRGVILLILHNVSAGRRDPTRTCSDRGCSCPS
jgi:hypothetical protein